MCFIGAVTSLLEAISDKDESVRSSVERALIRACKRRPNETIEIIYNFRLKNTKLAEAQVSLLLRYAKIFSFLSVFMKIDFLEFAVWSRRSFAISAIN